MVSAKMDWFREARFGMFIHWGVYALWGQGECFIEYMKADEYAKRADELMPCASFAARWAKLARMAGMKYVVFTSKHEDGFCNFATSITGFNSTRHGAKRDYLREVIEAFRAEGLRIGIYHAPLDLYHQQFKPGGPTADQRVKFKEQFHGFTRELLSNYGQIDLLWIDGQHPTGEAEEFYRLARELQPGIIINDRAGPGGDYTTPENSFAPAQPGQDWELCTTINDSWGYRSHDYNYKTANQLIFLLSNCAVHGGNLLLNISPRADGSVPAEQEERLLAMGEWLKLNGDSIYGVERLKNVYTCDGRITRKGGKLYLHNYYWPGSRQIITGLTSEVLGGEAGKAKVAAKLLATGEEAITRWDGDRLLVECLPQNPPDQADSVLVLETRS